MTISINNLLVKKVKNKETKRKETNKETLRHKQLQDFQKTINWGELVDITFQDYLESDIERLINPTETMLKVYFLQHRYGMLASDIEKAVTEIDSLREFALTIDVIPKASSIRAFANLLLEKNLSTKIEKAFAVEI